MPSKDIEKHRKKDAEYQKKKRAKLKGYKAKEFAEYYKKYPEKVRAHQILYRAIKKKLLNREPCSVCKSTYRIHGHHPDYSKPLDVVWVCTLHHKPLHTNKK